MNILEGLCGAPGICRGVVLSWKKSNIVLDSRPIYDPHIEIERLVKSRLKYGTELEQLKKKAEEEAGETGAEIFFAYQEILADDVFFEQVQSRISDDSICAEYAVHLEERATAEMFASLGDEYLQERAIDVSNVCNELISILQGNTYVSEEMFNAQKYIVVAQDLTPADTIRLDKSRLCGFVIERGGVTSHTAILAKSLGIPALVGVADAVEMLEQGEEVLLYSDEGYLVASPDSEQLNAYIELEKKVQYQQEKYTSAAAKPAITKDGHRIMVDVNAGDSGSMDVFDSSFCDGVGLFRTEFLYMSHSDLPSEEEQFTAYRHMAEKMGDKELIIRTLDIGGDKKIAYLDQPEEENPFLGYRAIRICLEKKDMFKTQLRAILRAGVYGNVKVMFPMIVTVEELLCAKQLLEEAKAELKTEGIVYKENLPVGIMVETPAAVILSDKLAELVDFFSIGSNDLTQYVTATDRTNETVQNLYNIKNVAVLRCIKLVCDAARKCGISVGMCGEAASDPTLIPLWVALGLHELSVAPSQVARVKYVIQSIELGKVKPIVDQIMNCSSIAKVEEILANLNT